MKLKHLEISGFKSFRDKVVLDFASGVSAVVGPNGCGKSNVVDAIRWVMGEQRVKSLRGAKMEDVIFNGSQEAEPVGMAEVSMHLAAEGVAFPDPYADCAELTVTRRLLRSGESEYAINGLSCRLLDVRELFLGTGVGARTYSIVEQNSVASLVEAKPEERRQFIEEAAGISKYRARKEAAVRKLEATKQNILRLEDILREVKGQLTSLSRQARRAEHYRNIKNNLREDELTVARDAFRSLQEEQDTLERRLQDCRQREEAAAAGLAGAEAALAAVRAELSVRERERARYQEEIYNLRTSVQVKEQGRQYAHSRMTELTGQRERLAEDIRLLQTRCVELREERERLAAARQVLDEDAVRIETGIREEEERLVRLKDELSARQRYLEEDRARLIDLAAERSRLHNNNMHLTRVRDDLRRDQERNDKDLNDNENMTCNLRAKVSSLIVALEEDNRALEELRHQREIANEAWEEAVRELAEVEEAIAGLKEGFANRSSRLASLKEFHDGYAWCNEATRSIMMARDDKVLSGVGPDQVIGLVAEQIRVPRDYETAVEAVLGDKLQYVIVRSQEAGIQAIDYLKEAAVGRSSFVPLVVRHVAARGINAEHLQEAERLLDHVEVKESFRGIAEYLLGDVLLIPDLRNGLALWNRNGFRGTFVTPEGDMISPQGVLTGGRNGHTDRSLLRNKREMETLEEEVNQLAAALAEQGQRKKELSRRVARGEEELENLTGAIHDRELQRNSLRKDLERYEDEEKRLSQTRKILEFNRERQQDEMRRIGEKLQETHEELAAQQQREAAVQEALSARQEEVVRLRGELEQLEAALTKEKVRQASLVEKIKAAVTAGARIQAEVTALEERIRKGDDDLHSGERELAGLQEKADREEAELLHLYESLATMEKELEEKHDQYAQTEASLKDGERRIQEAKACLEKIVQETRGLETEAREIAYRREGLVRMCAERYQVLLNELPELPARLDEDAVRSLQARIEKNRQSIETFGEVNLLAISEHDELRERFDFLTAQARDLDASLQTLQQTIAKINRISRQRFAETFEAVRGCFQDVFSRIFPGGKGELYLTDESDLLETGVDIDIRIPGKRSQNISLLSGGEKTLAAIALILAIILYRPTPFLVLDEVDAALDDANISLIAKIIREISINSQVILITHNKKTMEVAENLFGVTMQKQGISTVVSVSLN
ncbi:MAG: chromosome segregation protein SMC [Syntrophobacterales bacterium]|nr:chromosome segregation protein SMC [Syntrophobacterales bacterium]